MNTSSKPIHQGLDSSNLYSIYFNDIQPKSSSEGSALESDYQEEPPKELKSRDRDKAPRHYKNFTTEPVKVAAAKATELIVMDELCEYTKKLQIITLKIADLAKRLESNQSINRYEVETEYKDACNQFQLLQKDIDSDLKKCMNNIQYVYEKALEKEVLLPPPSNTRLSFIQNLQALTDIIKNVADFLSIEKTSLEPMNPTHKGKILASLESAFSLADNLSQDLRRQLNHVKKLSKTISEYQGALSGESPYISSGDEEYWAHAHQAPPAYDQIEGIQRSLKKYLGIAQGVLSSLYQKT